MGVFINGNLLLGNIDDILSLPKGSYGMAHLHLRVISGPQPLFNEKRTLWLVHNGEIYNYVELSDLLSKRGHLLRGISDSEVLLHLFEENSLNLVLGDYAFAIFDQSNNDVFLYRDPIGIRPLFYCFDGKTFSFASERKGLRHACDEILEVLPGHRVIFSSDGVCVEKVFTIDDFSRLCVSSFDQAVNFLEGVLNRSISLMSYPDAGIYFSGGIDSTVLASMLLMHDVDLTGVVVGFEKSVDLKNAELAARDINLKIEKVVLTDKIIEDNLENVIYAIEDFDVVKVSIAIPLYIASAILKDLGYIIVYSGQGADELFGGYRRYLESENFVEESLMDLKNLYERNLNRDDHVSMAHSLEVRYPYLHRDVVSLALSIPPPYKIKNGVRKYILRVLGSRLGLSKETVMREKKAIQYGSGVMNALRRLARRRRVTISDYLKRIFLDLFG